MSPERAFAPEKLLSAKPAEFDGVIGYAVFLDCNIWDGSFPKDERFICGVVPADGHTIEDAADHVIRSIVWLRENVEDPRVATVSPPVDRISYRERRVLRAVRGTHDTKSRILVSKLKPCFVDLNSGEIETVDTRSEAQSLDERDAWIARHGYDEDEGADSAQEAENTHGRVQYAEAQEGAAQ